MGRPGGPGCMSLDELLIVLTGLLKKWLASGSKITFQGLSGRHVSTLASARRACAIIFRKFIKAQEGLPCCTSLGSTDTAGISAQSLSIILQSNRRQASQFRQSPIPSKIGYGSYLGSCRAVTVPPPSPGRGVLDKQHLFGHVNDVGSMRDACFAPAP